MGCWHISLDNSCGRKNGVQLEKTGNNSLRERIVFCSAKHLDDFFEYEGEFASGHSLGELDSMVFDLAYGLGAWEKMCACACSRASDVTDLGWGLGFTVFKKLPRRL